MKKINMEPFYHKLNTFYNRIYAVINKLAPDRKKKNRLLMAFLAMLFIADYILFCIHAEKNPFDIFPVFPIEDQRQVINIYLPDIDGRSLLKETRKALVMKDAKSYIRMLFQKVLDGSEYENTSVAVPTECYIRHIWISESTCAIDVNFSFLKKHSKIIPGSENTFRDAVSKTITENVQSINEVILLDRGIPGRDIWELKDKS
ncbi:MAG: hypothetical protein MUC95_06405 [Spirochaetes bacterium]|nr:hypothetical protein [Spirochaetota bacterium]